MDRQRMKDNRHGFTLAELLVVIAIMMILAGVSFVGLSSYIRNLHVVEMDNAAKEIFIVAQNHLSQAYASGEYLKKNESYYGNKFASKPDYLDTPDDANAEYYYVIYTGYPSGHQTKTDVLNAMLPQYSIEEEIADYGNYIIAYEKNTATVLGVFYSGKTHTYFGSSPVHEFVADSDEVIGNNPNLKDAAAKREKRKHYLKDSENSVIGWYGSNGKEVVPEEAFNSIMLEIINGARLTAKVTNPNYTIGNTSQKLNLIVKGLTSGKVKTCPLTNNSEVTFILDDITSESRHFCNLFPDFIPGEDVEIYAELSDTSRFVAPIRSNVCVENSLFESYSANDSGKDIAEISNIRHLENLDPNVSSLGVTVEKAEQMADIVYGGESGSFAHEISKNPENPEDAGNIAADGKTITIYNSDGTTKLSDAKGYYGIKNSTLESYDGQSHSINNVYSVTGDGGNTGIFAETSISTAANPAKYFMIKNLTVKDSSFEASENSGGLVGYNSGNLRIFNCKFTGDSSEIKAVNGDAGALVGHSKEIIEIINSGVTGANLKLSSDNANAAGVVGYSEGALSVSNCIVQGDSLKITSTNANSGGIAALCGSTASIKSAHLIGDNISISGASATSGAGGILGSVAGAVTMESCSAAGEKLTVTGKNAGGIMGVSNGGLKITNTYCSSFAFATANAGGFIGNIDTGSENHIVNCYSSGHTKGKKYHEGKVKVADPDNYNVISEGVAGGFIGRSSVSTTINNSYSTCSVYSSGSTEGYAGGFVGKSAVLTVGNCYSTGLVSIETGGKSGGFIGQGAVSASVACYYLKGKGFNGTLKASADSGITNISSTNGTDILASGVTLDGFPWDSSLKEIVDETVPNKYKAKYPYMTVKELYDKHPTEPEILVPENMKNHYGDWIPEVAASSVNLSISNAERLEAIITIPTSNLETAGDDFVSMTVEGMLSGKKAYAQLDLRTGSMAILGSDVALANIVAVEGNEKIADSGNILFLDALSYSIKTVSDDTEFHIYLDDITTVGGNFAKIFTDFIPGEDIRITAESGFLSWSTLIGDAIDYETAEGLGSEVKITGVTNSLFAPGSGKKGYDKKTYYSDINFEKAIVEPIPGQKDVFDKTALILNFRHLQNLDKYVSNVDNLYIYAKIFRDLYWKPSNASGTNTPPAGYKDFLTAIGGSEVKIYAYDDTVNALTENNMFFGIMNENLIDVDGQNHSINNVLIYNTNGGTSGSISKENPDAGIFRYIKTGSTFDIKNLTINDLEVGSVHGSAGGLIGNLKATSNTTIDNISISNPIIITTGGNAGGLIGEVNNNSSLKVDYTYIYGEKALIRTFSSQEHSAGGFIGAAQNGGYNIRNCGASVYVYADTASCAGGFIGIFKPNTTTNIGYCFVGGHVQDGTEEYLENDIGVSTEISNEGGFNVCGNRSSGGFIGCIDTNDTLDMMTFTDCFTTASVHAEGIVNSNSDSTSGVAGGFVGRMKNSRQNQKYKNCYVAGEIFKGNSLVGAFVGLHENGGVLNGNYRPIYEGDCVLKGVGFNDDTGLKIVGFGSSSGYSVSGIDFVDPDSDAIKNKSAEYVTATTFNKKDKDYPYRDLTTDSLGAGVFYGDWMVPEKIESIEYVLNGNDLKFNLIPPDVGWQTENLDGETYYVRYIRLKGELSNAEFRWKVMFNEHKVIIKHPDWGGNTLSFTNAIAKFVTGILNGYLEITFDDIAQHGSSFYEILDGRSGNGVELIPGENISLYSSDTLEGLSNESSKYVEVNSLFERIEPNDDGPNTYTAFIGNARHLENLNTNISKLGIKVTRAKQTGNIYWEDDGTYGTSEYKAYYPPYLTENPDANVHESHGNTIAPGMMMALKNSDLKIYDGGGYTIYKLRIEKNVQDDCFGLFSSITNDLTIQNLILKDPVVSESVHPKALLVGKANGNLVVTNVAVMGNVNIINGQYIAGLVGESDGSVTLSNINVFNDINVNGIGNVGGIIGKANNSVSMSNVKIYGNVNVICSNWGSAGGMIGRCGGSVVIADSIIDGNASIYNTANVNAAGGILGGIDGVADISGASINGVLYINNNPDNRLIGTG